MANQVISIWMWWSTPELNMIVLYWIDNIMQEDLSRVFIMYELYRGEKNIAIFPTQNLAEFWHLFGIHGHDSDILFYRSIWYYIYWYWYFQICRLNHSCRLDKTSWKSGQEYYLILACCILCALAQRLQCKHDLLLVHILGVFILTLYAPCPLYTNRHTRQRTSFAVWHVQQRVSFVLWHITWNDNSNE